MQRIQKLNLGDFAVSVINIGDIYMPMASHMNVPDSMLDASEALRQFSAQEIIPIHNVLIETPKINVLIDAGAYEIDQDSSFYIDGYAPPPSLFEQLAQSGVAPEQIDVVIITHLHWDHFNGTTHQKDGTHEPIFKHARHYISTIDWERSQQDRSNPESIEARTLAILDEHDLIEQIDGDFKISEGIEIWAAPGETLGHQIAKISSRGETLFALGDLYNHPIEFANPEWSANWADASLLSASRSRLVEVALAERAYLVATHISEIGRLVRADDATHSTVRWQAI